jgi:transposase
MHTVELYAKVRRSVLIDGMSQREAASHYGLARYTVAKMLKHSLPSGYQRKEPPVSPKLDPYTAIIDQILESDKTVMKKQRHTAQRILERLRDEHDFDGGYTIVRQYVAKQQLHGQEVFIKLSHSPRHGQFFSQTTGAPVIDVLLPELSICGFTEAFASHADLTL